MSPDRKMYASQHFTSHRQQFAARPPNLRRQRFDDEILPLLAVDGLREFPASPAPDVLFGEAPKDSSDAERERATPQKHLWVVTPNGIPFIAEYAAVAKYLDRGSVSHTNLTGGLDAHSGGEVWFETEKKLSLNGGSSRYPPRNAAELASVGRAFAMCGYQVVIPNGEMSEGQWIPGRFFREGEIVQYDP
jgi:hypothetical protein